MPVAPRTPARIFFPSLRTGTVRFDSGECALMPIPPVGRGADAAGDDGDDAVFEQREKNGAATLPGLIEMRLGVAEIFAGHDEIRRRDGYGGDSGLFERGGKEARAQTFTERREAIKQLGAGGDAALGRNFVKKIGAEKLELPANAESVVFLKLQIAQDIEVERQEVFDFAAGVDEFSIGESAGDGEKMIGDALHGGDDDGDVRDGRGATDETRGMEHALRAEKRASAKFKGDDVQRLRADPAGAYAAFVQRGGAAFRGYFFVHIFEAHDLRSLLSVTAKLSTFRWSVSGGGLKEETHRQVRFRRWVGNFLLVR